MSEQILVYNNITKLRKIIRKFKWYTWAGLGMMAILLPIVLFSLWNPFETKAEWWDEGWAYRKKFIVTSTNGSAQNEKYISFDDSDILDTSDTTRFQSDCGDIRFVDGNGHLLPYYINSGCGTASTDIDVWYDSFPDGKSVVYMYYGNPSAENGFSSDGFDTGESGGDGWLSGWDQRMELVVSNAYNTDEDLTHFPLLLKLGTNVGTGDDDVSAIFDEVGANSQKIAITKSDGTTQIYGEIESWNSVSEIAEIWVSKSDLTLSGSANTTLYFYYDNDQSNNTTYIGTANSAVGRNVWNSNYLMVHHLDENTTSATGILDSTSNGHNSTSVTVSGTGSNPGATGKVGLGIQFDGSDDNVNFGTASTLRPTAAITISGWYNTDGLTDTRGSMFTSGFVYGTSGIRMAVNHDTNLYPWTYMFDGSGGQLSISGNTSPHTAGTWNHLAVVFNGTVTDGSILYKNGSSIKVATSPFANIGYDGSVGTYIGGSAANFSYDGYLDEIRVSNIVRSAKWIMTEKQSDDDNLVNWGTAESAPTVIPNEALNYTIGTAGSEEKGPGPIAHWKLDEGTDNTCRNGTDDICDAASGSADGVNSGATWQSEDMCVDGKCLLFDGANDVVTFADTINNVQTVSFWVKVLSASTTEQIIDLNGTDYITSVNGTITAGGFGTETIYVDGNTGTTITADTWHHIAITTASSLSGSGIKMGQISTDYGNVFIDEIKFYSYARSADQVKSDFNFGSALIGRNDFRHLTNGLIAYWDMDETSGNANDSSGNNYTLTNNGTTPFSAGRYGHASSHSPASNHYFSTATTITGVKTISFWSYPDSNTNNYIDLDNSAYLTSTSGTLAATGFTEPRIYVDGVETTTIAANKWQLVTVTTDTAIDADSFTVGEANGSYYDGHMDEVKLFSRTLNSEEIADLYDFAPGPVGHWKLDEQTGTNAFDSSGNGFNATTYGNMAWVNGKYGSALRTINNDGVMQYAATSDHDELDFSNTKDFTLSAWVKTGSAETNYWRIAYKDSAPNTPIRGYYMYITSGNKINCGYRYGTTLDEDANYTLPDQNWHHVSCVMDRYGNATGSEGLHLFIDGVWVASDTTLNASDASNDGGFKLGEYSTDVEHDMTVDDVRIYNYARSPQQVIEDMNAGHPAGGSPIGSQVLRWKFDEGANNTCSGGVYDTCDSVGNRDGLLSGATWLSGTSCKFGSCLSFDGIDDSVTIATANDAEVDFNGTEAFSIGAWVYPTSVPNNTTDEQGIITKWDTTSGQRGYVLYLENDDTDSTGRIGAAIRDNSASQFIAALTPDDSISANNWYHVLFTFNGGLTGAAGDVKIYLNGKLVGTSNANANFLGLEDVTADFVVGDYDTNDTSGDNDPFAGLIDEVQVYNSALTADQVKIVYNENSSVNYGSGSSIESASLISGSGNPPVGYFPMDDNTGTSVKDLGTGQNDLAFSGSPKWRPGKIGQALYFNGTTDVVYSGDNNELRITGDLTFSFWMNSPKIDHDDRLLNYRKNGEGEEDNELYLLEFNTGSGNDIRYVHEYGAGSNQEYTFDTNLSTNTWYHITVTRDVTANTVKLYVDGKYIDTYNYTSDPTGGTEGRFLIGGGDTGGTSQYFEGLIDEVKVYDYIRTQSQIMYDYNRGKPVGWWKFDECQGSIAYDASGYGKNGTINPGDASGDNDTVGTCGSGTTTEMWNDGTTGKRNASLGFDGTNDYVDIGNTARTDIRSLSFWVKPADTTESVIQLSATDSVAISSGTVTVAGFGTETVYVDGKQTTAFPDSNWHHVTIVSSSDITANDMDIGRISTTYFSGQIDDVRIYNYSLSANQVKNAMNDGAVRYGP